jgi:hypothetical protein
MIKSLTRLARGFLGIWSELRRLRILLEWILCNGLTGEWAGQRLTIHALGLPPTSKEQREAEAEKNEYQADPDEELLAADALVDFYKRKSKGETIDPSEPGSDWNPYA